MQGAGVVRAQKMFGEYGVYCDEKVIGFICDDQLFLKITDPGRAMIRSDKVGPPYPGAKDYFIVSHDDCGDAEYLSALVRTTADALPLLKKKPKKK